ncbi:MAG: substrate-binding domain-containing protein [Candidatus Thiodiazotropha sp. (ex Ctena orbiculata)]|nr:substrate-binding domain-containing protein [Candidatus Thiodiazotropha taylori]MBT2996563.1 substrate-binding domain-containing protein [Candidatus Thiodiazotropha taylori]MBT3000603.1 substrate-binding domain-containing protein [Candidatus Thiodiazotropha taylori]MBV2106932.1 substrate-binding domain-containing protein [Candidatus Thiodiazotropha taylori]MBV2111130.1 substrate-binding domain-containing protein [Candidatus Thiodiazotropha taylori]
MRKDFINEAKIMSLSRLLLALTCITFAVLAEADERIRIVGSSNVLSFVQPVAEHFARNWDDPTPSLEITGTGAGFQLFCEGLGMQHPDVIAAIRPITERERKLCAKHGVANITEIEFGRDAVVLVHSKKKTSINLTRRQLFTALAFHELVMVEGCKTYQALDALEKAEREKICRSLRRDNHVVNSAKREDVTIGWVEDDDSRHAITSFTNYMIYSDKLDASLIEGVEPTYETISNQRYPLVTGLYVYVKDQHKQHLPNLQNFLYELTSERALAPEGYLAEDGLVTLDDIGRNKARDMVLEFGM